MIDNTSHILAQASTPVGGNFSCIGGYCPQVEGLTGGSGLPTTQFTTFASNLFAFLTTVGGLMFILYFALGGLAWISAGGDTQKVDNAKAQMTNGAIGLIVIVAAYSIAFIIGKVLGLDILNPAEVIDAITPGGFQSGSSPGGGSGINFM